MTTKLALTSGGGGALIVDDVFASWVYTGTSAIQNIANGVNLLSYGGMVWTKSRAGAQPHLLTDTVRGVAAQSSTSTGYGTITSYGGAFSAFNTNGYALGTDSNGQVNNSGATYASWSFRRAPRFFDVVTYTGNGAARTIPHQLGVAPGFIMVKRTDGTGGSFFAYHRSGAATGYFDINSTGGGTSATIWNSTAPTASVFSVGADTNTNANGAPYVAYLFAHDTSTDGVIQCGSYAGNGSASGPTITLGWEPQCLITSVTPFGNASMTIVDTLRGLSMSQSASVTPNNTNTESDAGAQIGLLPDGFRLIGTSGLYNGTGNTYYYVAIRRPTKQPSAGTQVFSPHTYSGNGVARTITTPGFRVDAFIGRRVQTTSNLGIVDRLRGPKRGTYMNGSAPDVVIGASQDFQSFAVVDGYTLVGNTDFQFNGSGDTQIAYALRRARGFFDQARYVGNGTARTIPHQLGAVPEMMLVRCNQQWTVYHAALGAGYYQSLISAGAGGSDTTYWNNTAPTASVFSVGTSSSTNLNTVDIQAYLFATLPGISKVGSYTGNGTSQTIDCGFTTGARFVMVKRATTTGAATTNYSNGWCVADTARGLVTATEPVFAVNNTAADASYDWIDPANSGFIINQDANTDLNVNGVQYIYLAIA